MKKVMTIFGTRPEAIKLAPVILELQQQPDIFDCQIVSTGQHREMLDQVLRVFDIVPHVDLDVMQPEQTLSELTARLVAKIAAVFSIDRPDLVLVQGDTTSTFVGALVAHYHKVQVGHVEAGLRTLDKNNPFPEEMNRRLTGAIADLHFAPTTSARANLLAEGVPDSQIFVTGNNVIDAMHYALERQPSRDLLGFLPFGPEKRKLILITTHRRENWDGPIENICQAILQLEERHPDVGFVFSVHLNPIIQRVVKKFLAGSRSVYLTKPLDYLLFLNLMQHADIVLTDSGGIQEEAPGFGKPVLVMRKVTERQEGVAAGTVRLVGTEVDSICREVSELLENPESYRQMAQAVNPYGDGRAAKRIAKIITHELVEQLLLRP